MGKVKYEPFIKQTNRFAALADSDSDDDKNDLGMQVSATPEVELAAPEMQDLTDYPPYAPPSPVLEAEEAPQFRVWKNDTTRFSSENNIFSSPFSRKTKKSWSSIDIDVSHGEDDAANSKDWAAKIMVTLDAAKLKAEKLKAEKDRQFHKNNMSFFRTPVLRRTVVLDEKF
jgi:hypothetical protein